MKIRRLAILAGALLLLTPLNSLAISQDQRQVFNEGVYYFNTEQSALPTTGCGGAVVSGAANESAVFNYFVGKGLTAPQAAGITGNMEHESNLEPERLQGTSPGTITPAETLTSAQLADTNLGWGIVQWTPPGKYINLIQPISQANDINVQLNFVWNQLTGTSPLPEVQAGNDLKSTTNANDAAEAFLGNTQMGGQYGGFERPKDEAATLPDRQATARAILAKYGSTAGGASSSDSVSCSGSSDSASNGYSLPVDKKWYTQHPDWFSKPHHDYPAADIPVPANTPVYSMTSGKVIGAGSATVGADCGQGVEVTASPGINFLYCHGMDGGSIVKVGDQVTAGQLIMHSGYTGSVDPPGAAGAHLHVQISVNGQNVCPQSLFAGIINGNIPSINSLPSTGCFY